MKSLAVMAFLFAFLFKEGPAVNRAAIKPYFSDVPAELLTGDTTYWTVSTLSSVTYKNTATGPYYNTCKNGGGTVVRLKFLGNNRFLFRYYIQANSYGAETETWTETEGTVRFTKDEKGQPVFITLAEKGTYRITRNGKTVTRAISETELKNQHSSVYLWERFDFPEDPAHRYLLLVDKKQHPEADINKKGSIDPSWVSRFHIPKKDK